MSMRVCVCVGGGGSLYGEVPMRVSSISLISQVVTWEQTECQTDTTKNVTFAQLLWREVTNESVRLIFSHLLFSFCPFTSTYGVVNVTSYATLLSAWSSGPDSYMSLNHSDSH